MSAKIEGTFEVVGAGRALSYFAALDEARLSHGYLFSGPAGVGKKTFARRLAQSLLCEHPKRGVLGYDGTCPACKSLLAGSHPDFYERSGRIVIGESETSASVANLDDIEEDDEGGWTHGRSVRDQDRTESRVLVRELQLHPYSGRWRIVLLGDAEFASNDAANALLKFFEEPPRNVLIILTTDAPHVLLPTIRSRLIDIPFAALPSADVVRILEADGVPAGAATVAATSSMGSITRARAILEASEAGLREAAIGWFEAALAGRAPDSSFLEREPTAGEKRRAARELLEFVYVIARDWAALALAGDDVPLIARDQRERVARLPVRSPDAVVRALAAVADTQLLADTNVSPNLVLDYLRMQLVP